MRSSYYGLLPANIRYDKELTPAEKLLYVEITSVLTKEGKCDQDNEYFSEIMDVDPRTITRYLKNLETRGFIERKLNHNQREIHLPQKIVANFHLNNDDEKLQEKADLKFVHEVIDLWNGLFIDSLPRGIRRTAGLVSNIMARLHTFSKEEVLEALKNRHGFMQNSKWHNREENRHHLYNIDLVIRNDEQLQKFLNIRIPDKDKIGVDLKSNTVGFKPESPDTDILN